MTKQHFIRIADGLYKYKACNDLILYLADHFAEINPAFDRARFIFRATSGLDVKFPKEPHVDWAAQDRRRNQ